MNNFQMALETLIDRAVAVGARMRSPDGVEQSVIDKLDESKALIVSIVKELDDERARLLALLAPEPEPSDAEIEAGERALLSSVIACGMGLRESQQERRETVVWIYREMLTAARAARQTGGEK